MSISTRCVFGFFLVLGCMTFSCLQGVMNVAIVAMVNEDVWAKTTVTSDECSDFSMTNSNSTAASSSTGEFYWDAYTQGILLGANSYGTIFTHFLGGLVSAKYGGKWVFGGGNVIMAIFSCLTPMAARAGVIYIFMVRFFFGFAEGVVAPASVSLIARWAPKNERGTFIGLSIAGFYLGNAFVSILTGFLSSHQSLGGWPAVFYITGGIGCVWFLIWALLAHSSPEDHSFISNEELEYIKLSQGTSRRPPKVPWSSILRSCQFCSILFLNFCYLWLATTFATAMPQYLKTVLKVPIEYIGLIIGLVYPANIAGSLLGGVLADYLRRKSRARITTIRKIFSSAAFLCGAFCFLIIPLLGCDLALVFVFMFITKFTFSLNSGGCSVVLVDMAPQFAGVLNGLSSTVSGTTGFLAPLLTGSLINDDVTRPRWFLVFVGCVLITLTGLFVFLCLGSAEVQPWATLKNEPHADRDLENSERSKLVVKDKLTLSQEHKL